MCMQSAGGENALLRATRELTTRFEDRDLPRRPVVLQVDDLMSASARHTGGDIMALGVPAGLRVGELLRWVHREQAAQRLATTEATLDAVRGRLADGAPA